MFYVPVVCRNLNLEYRTPSSMVVVRVVLRSHARRKFKAVCVVEQPRYARPALSTLLARGFYLTKSDRRGPDHDASRTIMNFDPSKVDFEPNLLIM